MRMPMETDRDGIPVASEAWGRLIFEHPETKERKAIDRRKNGTFVIKDGVWDEEESEFTKWERTDDKPSRKFRTVKRNVQRDGYEFIQVGLVN